MTEYEKIDIARAVKEAKVPRYQRKIEAELRGMTLSEIDAILKEQGVFIKKYNYNHTVKRQPKIPDSVLKDLYKSGMPITEIARKLGYSKNTVYGRIMRILEMESLSEA